LKGLIYKIIFVFLITVIISIFSGIFILEMEKNEEALYMINEIEQTDIDFKEFAFQMGITIFVILTMMSLGFYVRNIVLLIATYSATKTITNEDVIYQRDLPKEYNSAIASYIIDGTIEVKQDYKAVLVELEDKGLIYKENGKYKINEEKENLKEQLFSNQLVVLNQIKEGKINFNKFKKAIISDSRKLGYTKINIAILFILFFTPFWIFTIIYMLFATIPWMMALTDKGKKEKDIILKLKLYLTQFSNLHELETSDNNIWGEYLAYAISLKVNKNLKVRTKKELLE